MNKSKLYYLIGAALVGSFLWEGITLPANFPVPNDIFSAPIAQAATTYRVKLGDTLSGIAARYRTSVGRLLQLNPSLRRNPNLLRVGQVIYLSPSSQAAKPPARRPAASSRRQAFRNLRIPRQIRAGSNRVGARRGPGKVCTQNPNDKLRALLPDTNFGYTLTDYPTFFWYQPALNSEAIPIQFNLRMVNRNGEEESFEDIIYTSPVQIQKSGIVGFTLPPTAPPLEEGKEYEWEIKVECDSLTWIITRGRIQRLSTNNPDLSRQLEAASIEDYPAIYAQAEIWYDALATLAALRQDDPTDVNLAKDWSEILKLIGFEDISTAPIVVSR